LPPPAKASLASIRERLNFLFLRLTPTERQRLLLLTILSGGLCGLAAVCFHVGIGRAEDLVINRALAAPYPTWIYLAILTPAVGGLLVGLALHYWVPGAVGSGVPQVKVAYALHAGHVSDSLLGLRNRFKNFTSVPKWVHPAVGGALTGGLAVVALLSLGGRAVTSSSAISRHN
jgi:H+/Cl- antiporter ClcA